MFSRLAQNLGSGVHPLTSWISSSDIHGENSLPIFTGGTNKHIAAVAANNLSKHISFSFSIPISGFNSFHGNFSNAFLRCDQ